MVIQLVNKDGKVLIDSCYAQRFLKIVGMKHSQENIVIGAETLEEIGAELCKAEKEIREGLGLRASQRKTKDWKVSNTIDFIKVVLESWGCCNVESVLSRPRINGKQIKQYSLSINSSNMIWNRLYNANINYNENCIQL